MEVAPVHELAFREFGGELRPDAGSRKAERVGCADVGRGVGGLVGDEGAGYAHCHVVP